MRFGLETRGLAGKAGARFSNDDDGAGSILDGVAGDRDAAGNERVDVANAEHGARGDDAGFRSFGAARAATAPGMGGS